MIHTRDDLFYDSAFRKAAVLEELIDLIRYRHLVRQLIVKSIKSRYKRSFLGVVWTLLNPLMMMAVFSLIFSQIFRGSLTGYPVYLLAGLLFWNFFSQSTTSAMYDLVWSGSYLRRIYMPRTILVISAVGTGLTNLLLALVPLGIIMAIMGQSFHLSLLFLPVAIFMGVLFTVGLGLLMSLLSVFFTDVVEFYQVLLTTWLYLTPIIYPKEILPGWLLAYQWLNPMIPLIECFRDPIYLGRLPGTNTLLAAAVTSVVALVLGWWCFCSQADEIAYHV